MGEVKKHRVEFREVPCFNVHPEAKKLANQLEHMAAMGHPSSFLSDEQFAGAVTMAAHVLAEMLIRMMKRAGFPATWVALQQLGEMIANLVKADFTKAQHGIVKAGLGVPSWRSHEANTGH